MVEQIEGAPVEGATIEAFGNAYRVADRVALMPMMRFAYLAKRGADSADMEAMVAMYDLLRGVFAPEDWERFERDAMENQADDQDLMRIVQAAISAITARPTGRPSASSPGPQTTTPNSTGSSSFEERKRALGLVPVIEAAQELAG